MCIAAEAFLLRTPRAHLKQDAQSRLHMMDFDFAVRAGDTILVLYKQVQGYVI